MAVYTHVSEAELRDFLDDYDLGSLERFEGIQGGVENTNYHVFTDQGRYVLTLFEKRVNPKDLPFFFSFTDHLTEQGIVCPAALRRRDGKTLGTLCGRPAVLINFLEGSGVEPDTITSDICYQMGAALARLHLAAERFSEVRENSVGLAMWQDLYWDVQHHLEGLDEGLSVVIAGELDKFAREWPQGLPRGIVHADAFPDNVFFKDGQYFGIIDFYFSCQAEFVYDLAMVVNAWCFDMQDEMVVKRFEAMVRGYEEVRTLSQGEKDAFAFMGCAAAVRILMTRLYDWFNTPEDALVKPKDPMEYVRKLRYHHRHDLFQKDQKVCA